MKRFLVSLSTGLIGTVWSSCTAVSVAVHPSGYNSFSPAPQTAGMSSGAVGNGQYGLPAFGIPFAQPSPSGAASSDSLGGAGNAGSGSIGNGGFGGLGNGGFGGVGNGGFGGVGSGGFGGLGGV